MRASIVVLLLFLSAALPTYASSADPFGNDGGTGHDAGDDAAHAQPLPDGVTRAELKPVIDEHDVWSFNVSEGDLILIALDGATGSLSSPTSIQTRLVFGGFTFPVLAAEGGTWVFDVSGCVGFPVRTACPYEIRLTRETARAHATLTTSNRGWKTIQGSFTQPGRVWWSLESSEATRVGPAAEGLAFLELNFTRPDGSYFSGFAAFGSPDASVGTLQSHGLHVEEPSTTLLTTSTGWYTDRMTALNGTFRLSVLSTGNTSVTAGLHFAQNASMMRDEGSTVTAWRSAEANATNEWYGATAGRASTRDRDITFEQEQTGLFWTSGQFGNSIAPDQTQAKLTPSFDTQWLVHAPRGYWQFTVEQQQRIPDFETIYLLSAPIPALIRV